MESRFSLSFQLLSKLLKGLRATILSGVFDALTGALHVVEGHEGRDWFPVTSENGSVSGKLRPRDQP